RSFAKLGLSVPSSHCARTAVPTPIFSAATSNGKRIRARAHRRSMGFTLAGKVVAMAVEAITARAARSNLVPGGRARGRGGQQRVDVLHRQLLADGGVAAERRLGDLALLGPELDHLLLDAVLDDQ